MEKNALTVNFVNFSKSLFLDVLGPIRKKLALTQNGQNLEKRVFLTKKVKKKYILLKFLQDVLMDA